MKEAVVDSRKPFFALEPERLAIALLLPLLGMLLFRFVNAKLLGGELGLVFVPHAISSVFSPVVVLFAPRFYRGHLIASSSSVGIFILLAVLHFVGRAWPVEYEKAYGSDDISGLVVVAGLFVYGIFVPFLFIGCLRCFQEDAES